MLTMLFVNDCSEMAGIPHWMRHADTFEDMLGFPDLVFPAFLFCVGMSAVLAMQNRLRKGDDWRQILLHVLGRTVALVAMGLYAMNLQPLLGMSKNVFELLFFVACFMAFNVCPNKKVGRGLQIAGWTMLVAGVILCEIYGRPFRVGWWGILGLIGWTYFVCSMVFFFTKGNFWGILIAFFIVHLLGFLSHLPCIPEEAFSRVFLLNFVPADWENHALGVSGMLAVSLLLRYKDRPAVLMGIMAGISLLFILAGFGAHQIWIISKNQSTPTWVYFCLAISFPMVGFFHYLVDVWQKGRWFRFISPAWTNTLTCYLIPYAMYPLMWMSGFAFPEVLSCGIGGMVRSLVLAFVVIGIVAVLRKYKIVLKV